MKHCDTDETTDDDRFEASDRPSFVRVESFLGQIEDRRRQVRRTRWLASLSPRRSVLSQP